MSSAYPTELSEQQILNRAFDATNNVINTSASGGGGGGAATIADGADVTQGAIADASVAAGATGSLSAKLRRISSDIGTINTNTPAVGQAAMVASSPVVIASNQTAIGSTVADGSNVVQGATTDAAVTAGSTGTISGKLRTISSDIGTIKSNTPAVGQTTMAASSPVTIASDQSAVAVKGAATGSAVPSTAFYMGASDGTNIVAIRTATQTTNAASGMLGSALVAQLDDVSPTTVTENQFGNVRMSTDHSLLTTIQNSYNHISTATTTTVKSGVGTLKSITVNTLGTVASTATIYDSTTGSGTIIAIINTLNLSGTFSYNVQFSTGLTIVTTGTAAPDITVSYK